MELFLTITFTLIISSLGFPYQNEDCSQGGKIRECIEVSECPTAQEEIKQGKYPDLCGFSGRIPRVCCTKKTETVRLSNISEIQCKKYEEMTKKFNFEIVGGEKIFDFQYPHMAALGFGPDNSKSWQCGGTLISERFILTAAHCLVSKDSTPVRWIRLGGLNIANLNEKNAQTFKVARAIMHPDYRPPAVYHDVALLEMDRDVQFSVYIKPACLHRTEYPVSNLAATGWGLVEFNGEQSDQLQRVYLEEFSTESCKNSYKDVANTRRLKQGIVAELQLCAGSKTEVKDTCPGDSGGPLQAWREGGFLFNVVGVTSFGKGCGVINVPGVYVRVSTYVPWIESIVWSELLN